MFSGWQSSSSEKPRDRDSTNNSTSDTAAAALFTSDVSGGDKPSRRHTTSSVPSSTAADFQQQQQQRLNNNDNNNIGSIREEDEGGSTSATDPTNPRRAFSMAPTPSIRTSQSERPAMVRESSSTDYENARLQFLKIVKKVQHIKRVEKILRQHSAPATTIGRQGLVGPRDVSTTSTIAGGGTTGEPSEHTALLNNSTTEGTTSGGGGTGRGGPGDLKPDMAESAMSLMAEHPVSITSYLFEVICGKGIISLCLLAAPFAIVSVHQEWGPIWVFWLNFTVMVPLAAILGDFTEEVALHTNQTIGGLINATFGNAVEVVVAIQALLANEIRVVQSSMLGSIFSNLLLVLGGCFFFGGIKHKEQSFNATAATANMALLALSGIALVLPTPFADYYQLHDEHVLLVSRFAAIFLIFMYIQLLVFQLHTHADIFEDGSGGDELAAIPFWLAGVGLLTTTLLVTIFSEYLVDSIDGFVEASGISRTFVGIIILPIVGNAVEHITAVTVAMKDKMDLAMGVAVGSCTQISLFVVPLTVLVGWATDRDMTLNFPHFEVILFVMSVFTVSVVLSTPKCNWLEGSLLMTTYLLIAVGFYFEHVESYHRK